MSNPLQQTIEALAKEKGIEPDVVISAIEEAVATASRKYYKTGENLKTRFNMDTGQVDLFALKQVVQEVANPATEIAIDEARQMYQQLYGDEGASSIELGDEMEFPKSTEVLGRIAAQTAKQVIFQKVREAERENIFAEYNQRVGEVVNGTVKRFENGDIIIEIGRIEAVLPRKEQSRAESYSPQDRVRTVIKGVNRSAKGPQIVLSRTDPALLIKLFEQEVPEIYDGTVMIRGAVREAGDRAKVAVYSRERDVDPVGACVGMKGTRVQSIIRELRGEKIDIVEFSDDPIAFVTNALSPAKVQRVSIVDDGDRVVEVVVEDKQLSLAIGKKGQNVRLAAKLTGWRIDIKSEEEKRREVEAQFEGMEAAAGVADGEDRTRRRTRSPRPRQATLRRKRRRRPSRPARRRRTPCRGWGEDHPEAGRRRVRHRRRGRRRHRGAAVGDSGHRRQDRREDPRRGTRRDGKWNVGRNRLTSGLDPGESNKRVRVGHCSDLQGRGTAEHHEPGGDRAVEARPRHRGEKRVEHDRRGRRAPVRRTARASAQRCAARRGHLRGDAGRPGCGEEGDAAQEGARAAQARRAGAAAATAREDRQAAGRSPADSRDRRRFAGSARRGVARGCRSTGRGHCRGGRRGRRGGVSTGG